MPKIIKFMDMQIDTSKLMTKDDLLLYLSESGSSDKELSPIRENNLKLFGNELIWRYPITEGVHTGIMIVMVQEGFVSLPYHRIDTEFLEERATPTYEQFLIDESVLLDEDILEILLNDWITFSTDLMLAITDMKRIECEKERD